ncbi:hypothetical protein TNCV_1444811 [Trichonephila clavipes]|nr:hypothetical protein TNCV_1444811 [Trichonephila clavipes]
MEKCAVAPSYMSYTFWYAVAGTPHSDSGKMRCKKTRYWTSLRRSGNICISTHSFSHSPRLAYRPPDGCNYSLEICRLYHTNFIYIKGLYYLKKGSKVPDFLTLQARLPSGLF